MTKEQDDFLSGMSPRVRRAYELAAQYHAGQTDKAGVPYITHPVTVAARCETEEQRIVALLHDTLEDTDLQPEVILNEFGPAVLEAVQCLTHRSGESYMDYVRRAGQNPIARVVKLADLSHNMQADRLPSRSEKDMARLKKYARARALLLSMQEEDHA